MNERFKTPGCSIEPCYNVLSLKAAGKILKANERIYDKPGDIISRYGSNR
jgi:hypothetical protein